MSSVEEMETSPAISACGMRKVQISSGARYGHYHRTRMLSGSIRSSDTFEAASGVWRRFFRVRLAESARGYTKRRMMYGVKIYRMFLLDADAGYIPSDTMVDPAVIDFSKKA